MNMLMIIHSVWFMQSISKSVGSGGGGAEGILAIPSFGHCPIPNFTHCLLNRLHCSILYCSVNGRDIVPRLCPLTGRNHIFVVDRGPVIATFFLTKQLLHHVQCCLIQLMVGHFSLVRDLRPLLPHTFATLVLKYWTLPLEVT